MAKATRMPLKSLSVFFLAYNDELTIGKLVYKAHFLLKRLGIQDFEIIVGNDASKDGTLKVLEDIKKDLPELRILNHQKNLGYGGNLVSGLKAARKEFVFYTDGDAQYDVAELEKLIEQLSDDVDVVNGFKKHRKDNLLRKVVGKVYQKAIKYLFGIKIKDTDCDFRLLRTSLVRNLKLTSTSGAICPELILRLQKAGARFKETGVTHYPREHGSSQFFKLGRILETFKEEFFLLKEFRYGYFRVTKFGFVGFVSVSVQFTVFNALFVGLKIDPAVATLLSDEVAIVCSFFLNNSLTFKDRKIKPGSAMLQKFVNYNSIVLVSTIIQTLTVFGGTRVFGLGYITSALFFFLGIFLGMILNYTMHTKLIWPEKRYEKARV